MRRSLSNKLKETQNKLQADDKQMARHLRLSLAQFKEIESGARVLPLPAQKTLERRMERLLQRCGLESSK
jgi:ribosomal protein S4